MDQSITLWQALVGVGIIEVLNWLITFRSSIRKAKTSADSDQFHLLKEAIEFLQQQLSDAISRNSQLTELRRADQAELRDRDRKIADLEIERMNIRCDILDCEFRNPPNIHTPPCSGIARSEYFRRRQARQQPPDQQSQQLSPDHSIS